MAASATLLYIENDPASLALAEELLARRKDVVLLRAASVKRAVTLARAKEPEVILLNIDLPGLAGPAAIEAVKLLHSDPATRNTPILALGAERAPEAVVKLLEAGFFHYLTKPMTATPFMEALDYALEFAAAERAERNDLPTRAARSHSKESR